MKTIRPVTLIMVCWLILAIAAESRTAAGDKNRPTDGDATPNIVVLLIDDLGWKDLGCYGSTFYETPNVDALARGGMRFTDAYSACPVCSPTRASLMTGRSPARLRFTGHITATGKHRYPPRGRIIPPDDRMYLPLEEVTLAEALRPAGYVSASIGKWHLGTEPYWPTRQGFDSNIAGYTHGSPPSYFFPYQDAKKKWNPSIPTLRGGSQGEYLTDRLTDEAIRFVRSNKDRPFFLYLSHYAVHTPLQAPQPLVKKYTKKLASDRSQKNATYAAMIESVDRNVGRLIDTLRELDLAERTVVIFTSDNGGLATVTNNAPLRQGKGWLYEGGIRVPLIVHWPGRIDAGAVCPTPVCSDDLYSTIVQFAGADAQGGRLLDGESLLPLLTGGGRRRRSALYWYYPHYSPQAKRPGAAVRAGDYKLIQHYDPPSVELYNLADDIGERTDLAKRMPKKTKQLRDQLHQWLLRVDSQQHTSNPAYQAP